MHGFTKKKEMHCKYMDFHHKEGNIVQKCRVFIKKKEMHCKCMDFEQKRKESSKCMVFIKKKEIH